MKVREEKKYKDVLNDLVRGMTISQVARKHGIAEITVYKYLQEAQNKGKIKREYNVEYHKKGKW